jgi:hypothetical protein
MTGCEIIKCPDFKEGKCTNELDYVSKIDGSPMCPRNDNAIPREEVYCHACSKAGGANMPIYHLAPVCRDN